MAKDKFRPQDSPPSPPRFLEVENSDYIRRFAVGTTAGCAVSILNIKRIVNRALALHIEAVKEGEDEEPIVFGPNTVLFDYGLNWKLKAFTEADECYIGLSPPPSPEPEELEESTRPKKKGKLEESNSTEPTINDSIEGTNDPVPQK